MASLVAEKNGQVDPISSCLNIMRRLPPANIEQNLSGLLNLVPSITDELLQRGECLLIFFASTPTPSLIHYHSGSTLRDIHLWQNQETVSVFRLQPRW